MKDKRDHERKRVEIKAYVRKVMPDGGMAIMEFRSNNLSQGGMFISTEDVSLFDLGEEIEILVDDRGEKFYNGTAKVVRSAREFDREGGQTESGFGLMFLNPDETFQQMLSKKLQGSEG